jgi:dihydrofolate reductase
MRKIIVSLNTTLDGFMSGSNGELDWHFDYWDEEMAAHANQHLRDADTIILGRVTYEVMSQYWQSTSTGLEQSREDLAFADMMNNYKKIVFSRKLKLAGWKNSSIVRSLNTTIIRHLKKASGKDMIVYGSGKIISKLMQLDLVDEFIIWTHPVILSRGQPAFGRLGSKLELIPDSPKFLRSGVLMTRYQRPEIVSVNQNRDIPQGHTAFHPMVSIKGLS